MFKILLLTLVAFNLTAYQAQQAYEVIPDEAKMPLLNEDLKQRKTLKIRLKNGLEAVLVSDPNTHESVAVMNVQVGSFYEPKDAPGLAHFLEHMLFLGTKKYPNESEYDQVVSQYKGRLNAFTGDDITAYFFSIDNTGFLPVLDRFATFFEEPLFNPSGIDRELNAIEQEYQKNLQNDGYKEELIFRELSNKDHPFHGFSSGNLKSLEHTDQSLLKSWYRSHYSSNRMRLFILSPLSLEAEANLVVEKFSQVPFETTILPTLPDDILSPLKGKMIYYEPLQQSMMMSFIWEMNKEESLDSKPYELATYVLGSEAQNSLAQILKQEGLATSVKAGSVPIAKGKNFFQIAIELTQEGLKNKNQVIAQVMGAVEKVRELKFSQSLYNEVEKTKTLNYLNQPRMDPLEEAMSVATRIGYEDISTYPEKSYLLTKYDPKANDNFLNQLSMQNLIISIAAPSKISGVTYTQKEKWSQTPYVVMPLPRLDVKPLPQFEYPPKNRFLPASLGRIKGDGAFKVYEKIEAPEKISDDDTGISYFWEDDFLKTLQAYVCLEIRTPAFNMCQPKSQAYADLYTKILLYKLEDVFNDASQAGFSLDFSPAKRWFQLTINGYSETMPLVLKAIADKLKLDGLDEETFINLFEQQKRDYENSMVDAPYQQIRTQFSLALYGSRAGIKEKAAQLKKVTFSDFKAYVESLYSKNYIASMIIGNLTKGDSKNYISLVKSSLGGQGYPVKNQKTPSIIDLNEPLILNKHIKAEGSALLMGIENPSFSAERRGSDQIASMGLKEAFFRELRTKQQTGYVVTSFSEDVDKHLFTLFLIQSATYAPTELLWRVEFFIENYANDLEQEIPGPRFDNMKLSLITSFKESPKNLNEYGELLFKLAFEFKGDFNWINERISALENLKYERFLELTRENLDRKNKKRLVLFLSGTKPPGLEYKIVKELKKK